MDSVDLAIDEFARAFPGVDTRSIGVTGRIRRINFYLDRNAEEVFRRFGATGPSYDVLAALYAVGRPYALTPTELYRGHMMSSAGVTARLDAVERGGLAIRSRDPRDRRGVIVTLTKKGEKLVRDAAAALQRRQSFVLALYSERERKQLLLLLKRLLVGNGNSQRAMSADGFESVAAPWLREFPKGDPWLIELLLVVPMLTIRINRESEELLARSDLSQTAMFILAALRRSPDRQRLSPRALARAALLSSAGLTAQLDQLERRALIQRSPDPSDRRAIHVTITRSGQKLVDQAIGAYLPAHERMLAPLSAGERQVLATLLQRLLASLEPSEAGTDRSDSIQEKQRAPAARSRTG